MVCEDRNIRISVTSKSRKTKEEIIKCGYVENCEETAKQIHLVSGISARLTLIYIIEQFKECKIKTHCPSIANVNKPTLDPMCSVGDFMVRQICHSWQFTFAILYFCHFSS